MKIEKEVKDFLKTKIATHVLFKRNKAYRIKVHLTSMTELGKQFIECYVLLKFAESKLDEIEDKDEQNRISDGILRLSKFNFNVYGLIKTYYNTQNNYDKLRYKYLLGEELQKDFDKVIEFITLFSEIQPAGERVETPDRTMIEPEDEFQQHADEMKEVL